MAEMISATGSKNLNMCHKISWFNRQEIRQYFGGQVPFFCINELNNAVIVLDCVGAMVGW